MWFLRIFLSFCPFLLTVGAWDLRVVSEAIQQFWPHGVFQFTHSEYFIWILFINGDSFIQSSFDPHVMSKALGFTLGDYAETSMICHIVWVILWHVLLISNFTMRIITLVLLYEWIAIWFYFVGLEVSHTQFVSVVQSQASGKDLDVLSCLSYHFGHMFGWLMTVILMEALW